MNKSITCFFTGHRDIPEKDYNHIKENTLCNIKQLYYKGYRNFICGGAVGFDQLAAETVLQLKSEFDDIKLYLVLPCEDQDKYFTTTQKEAYVKVRELADGVHTLYPKYVRGCMHTRNRTMANNSSACIAYIVKDVGGTAYTVNYAEKIGIDIFKIR